MPGYGMKLKKRPAPVASGQGVAMSEASRTAVNHNVTKAAGTPESPSRTDAENPSFTRPMASDESVLDFEYAPEEGPSLLGGLFQSESTQEEQAASHDDQDDGTEERFLVMKDYCLRPKGVECSRCQLACPMQAISFGENGFPTIDDSLCTRCGICGAICDGFSSNQITLEDTRERILRAASADKQVYLTCHENIFEDTNPAENVVVLPCLAALPPQMYALLLAEGIRVTLACDLSFCEDCFRAPGHGARFYTAAIQTAESWTGKHVGFADEIPEKQPIFQDVVNEASSRRDLFTGLMGNANKVASGEYRSRTDEVLADFFAMQERMRASIAEDLEESLDISALVPGGRRNKVLFPRHELLLSIAKVNPDLSGNIPAVISATDSAACCQSLECAAACPTSARYADEYGNLVYDAAFCIGCGICANACPHGACSLEGITLDQLPDLIQVGIKTEADLPAPVSAQYEPVEKTLSEAD